MTKQEVQLVREAAWRFVGPLFLVSCTEAYKALQRDVNSDCEQGQQRKAKYMLEKALLLYKEMYDIGKRYVEKPFAIEVNRGEENKLSARDLKFLRDIGALSVGSSLTQKVQRLVKKLTNAEWSQLCQEETDRRFKETL